MKVFPLMLISPLRRVMHHRHFIHLRGGAGALRGSGPFASLQEEPDVLRKLETIISSVSDGRRAPYILCWGAPGVKRAGAPSRGSGPSFVRYNTKQGKEDFGLPSI